jgi:hypothetical protein
VTFLIPPRPPAPPQIPARGFGEALPTFWDGLGAATSAMMLETDANFRSRRMDVGTRINRSREVYNTLGRDNAIALLNEQGMALDPNAPFTDNIVNDRRAQDILLGLAAEDPERFGFDGSPEGIKAEIDTVLQFEYQEAQDTLAMLPQGQRVVAELAGGVAGAMADVRNLPFLALGGGTGSLLRIAGREAILGAAGEAVTLPSQFQMAERLNIPDPNVGQQLAFGAIGGAVLGAGAEAIARTPSAIRRGIDYFRESRTLPQTPDPVAAELLTQRAEAEIEFGDDPIGTLAAEMQAFMLTPDMRVRLPEMTEDEMFGPSGTQASPAREMIDEAPVIPERPPEEIEAGLRAEIDRLRAEDDRRSSPLIQYLATQHQARKGDVNQIESRRLQVNPNSQAAGDLRAMGVTPKTYPGLFSKKGATEFDDLVASEMEDLFPGIRDAAGMADDGTNLDRDGLLRVIARAANGDYGWLRSRAAVAKAEADLNDFIRQRDEGILGRPPEPLAKAADVEDITFDLEMMWFGGDPSLQIERDFKDWLSRSKYGDMLTRREQDFAIDHLTRNGGSAEWAVTVAFERQLNELEADYGPARTNAGAGAAGDGTGIPDPGGQPRPEEGAAGGLVGADDVRTERTAAGDQSLIPGVAPVTDRDRIAARARERLIGQARSLDEGLFDTGSRAQMDWLDNPGGAKAQPVQSQRTADAREWAETSADPIAFEWDGQPRQMTAREALDELDADEAAAARLELCGMMRAPE